MNPLTPDSPMLYLADAGAGTPIGSGETAVFWVLGTIVLLGALGVVFSRKAVHSAMSMALAMVGLAIFYGINEAPFLMVVQIVVYTGAVLMLFLFVLMLVGVSSADSLVETLRGQRLMTAIVAICFIGALATGITRIAVGDPVGMEAGAAQAGGTIPWIGAELILRYVVAFEATAALLVTSVLGAMVLAHTARIGKRRTQREMSEERIRGDHPTPMPGPGTYARHNAIDMPALLPDGTVSQLSLNPVLTARDPEYQSEVPSEVQAGRTALPGGASDSASSQEGVPTAEEADADGGDRDGGADGGDREENGNGNDKGQEGGS